MNDIVMDAKIASYTGDERWLLARQHIETITQPKLLDNTMIIFVRGVYIFRSKRIILFDESIISI
jgi:hypothetical protein